MQKLTDHTRRGTILKYGTLFRHFVLEDLQQIFASEDCAMRGRMSSIMLMEFIFLACAVQFVQAQESHKLSARQVRQRWGVPITSLLLPGETRLVVVHQGSPPLLVYAPPGTSEAAWLTQISQVVMKARVVSRLSKLTPNEDWIETSVQMKILQVLKSTGHRSFNVGQEVSFVEPGGSLDIEGRQIDAIVEWARGYEVGKEYLIFAGLTPDNLLVIGPSSVFEIGPEASLRWLLKTKLRDRLSESSLSNVLEDIQRHADVVDEK